MKRGITPLMATVLLITFAITFGIFAMTIGTRLENRLEQNLTSYCEDVSLGFLEVNSRPYVCRQDSLIKFMAVNKGTRQIDSLQIIVVGDSIEILEHASVIKPHDSHNGEIIFDSSSVGEVTEVQFIPKIRSGSDHMISCISHPVVIVPEDC